LQSAAHSRAFCFWGRTLPISEELLKHELQHAAKLDCKHRGELAELAFMRRAAALGFAVAKPWGDSDRYDVILRVRKVFWRVQIKSVWAKYRARTHYRLKTTGASTVPYSAEEIDFLVAYIFPEDAWYVFPVVVVENCQVMCITPESKRSRFNQYREAWDLMRPTEPEIITAQPVADDAIAPASGSAP
jgi:hypothetical protein